MAAGKTERKAAEAGAALSLAIRPLVRLPRAPLLRASLQHIAEAADLAGFGAEWADLRSRDAVLADFLGAVFEASPFLRDTAFMDFGRLLAILAADPDLRFREICETVGASWRTGDLDHLMSGLRRARREVALLVALADLGGVWSVEQVTAALTGFADVAVSAAVAFLLAEAHAAGTIRLPHPDEPARDCGWILLGMGKFGAAELNYSSDIDLIVLFDPDKADVADRDEIGTFFVKLTRRLVRILQEYTSDGYVFRTDLRLRPDPGSTPVAISTVAAFQYYEGRGQNWERAALIKAWPVAGDLAAGQSFLAELAPFIWRKYLDYAAIADIHSIKRQINEHRGHDQIAVAGHNVKLGRGGIREIEFFVQTQQLIAGGRDPELRGRRTLEMLTVLARKGWIAPEAERDLANGYRFLRQVEHRLQMIADEQTHTLPDSDEGLDVIARLMGEKTVKSFSKVLVATLEMVREHYTHLFEAAPSLSSTLGSLVFTGDDEDPETVATLAGLGYANPREVSRTIRGWHFGRYPAMRSAAARERLTEITPALLEALATTDNADAAFNAFDRFLARLPAGVQLFALLGSNPGLLNLLATIMGTAPRLAEIVTARPHVLDAVLDPAFFGRLPDRKILAARLDASLGEARALEEVLDRARIFGKEQAFLIGVRVITGTVGARAAGFAYADLADLLLSVLLDHVRKEFETVHGRMKKGRVALVALGKLGGREMTAASDLDLILLYDFAESAVSSDGERPLSGSQYYARLTQRLITAISARTAEGSLYEVDFRLRPSGNAGPLATHIRAFAEYQAKAAWTWEHMALTRARPIAGDRTLIAEMTAQARAVLTAPHDRKKVTRDVLDMRALLQAEKTAEGPWDLKQVPGGQVDIEFIAQYLQLVHGATHPDLLSFETEVVLASAAKAGLLPPPEAEILLPGLRLYQRLVQILRLCVVGPFEAKEAPRGLLDLLARAGDLPDFATLDAHLRATEKDVRASFERIIGKVPPKPRA
ncbi:bifunctional [glutamine synthetase] adenylyltransferase/[glutamine synthetase]-adenylyl-L-tyrosine phosphorylase [Kaistia dalseonensis]|uniref:Bifunctional glutamine synthetase adenylyltransferase/adenylyl-removing enzyme n=1 Tax=Kaistia dalseonensis TaxID=410840 RepID=A0ABU0H015_9HYPH|nr:bifunctional [glutamine synthetase] adenylyltransferase/[glutamine synthetase]-adenylyl-L-tyrosine phosphorylase [Kaistia dalseonensis]MCX5493105.1 bifunctional [glutamine synthetase] adenylyltransferase/[glutamine synthetase]-adenylyl-L-tyrosine phosphorylase [Kaistia dalseonensis]MDQ0435660.1 glutamate-ammonia-ligase adenylyltransferase [Kaistia dalseonensis]